MLPVGGYSVSSTHAVPSDRRLVAPNKENCECIKFERDMEQDFVELKNQYELWIGDISCTYNSHALVKDSDVPSDAFDYYREAVNKIASRIIARLEEGLRSSQLYGITESKVLAYSSYLINKIFLNYPSDDQLIKKLFELNSRYSHNLYALLQHLESFLNGLHPVFLEAEGCFDKEQISSIILQLKRGLPPIVMLGGMHKMQPQMRAAIKLYLNIINYLLNNVQLLGDLKSINTLTDIYNRFIEIRFSSLFDIGEHIYRVYDNRNVLRMLYSLSFLPEIYKKKISETLCNHESYQKLEVCNHYGLNALCILYGYNQYLPECRIKEEFTLIMEKFRVNYDSISIRDDTIFFEPKKWLDDLYKKYFLNSLAHSHPSLEHINEIQEFCIKMQRLYPRLAEIDRVGPLAKEANYVIESIEKASIRVDSNGHPEIINMRI